MKTSLNNPKMHARKALKKFSPDPALSQDSDLKEVQSDYYPENEREKFSKGGEIQYSGGLSQQDSDSDYEGDSVYSAPGHAGQSEIDYSGGAEYEKPGFFKGGVMEDSSEQGENPLEMTLRAPHKTKTIVHRMFKGGVLEDSKSNGPVISGSMFANHLKKKMRGY